MLAAKLFPLGRVVSRRSPVTHSSQFSRGEQLQLPHAMIIPWPTDKLRAGIGVRSCQMAAAQLSRPASGKRFADTLDLLCAWPAATLTTRSGRRSDADRADLA
jgi:hypothetical protein